jgi:hypothetical protein
LNRAREQTTATETAETVTTERNTMHSIDLDPPAPVSRFSREPMAAEPPTPMPSPVAPAPLMPMSPMHASDDESQVCDLPAGQATELSVLAAVMRNQNSGLIESPVKAPQCPSAAVAVSRDRKLVLVAVARKGLSELRAIGQAYKWVVENRPLLSMALPQFSIDAQAMPTLRLVVDRSDADADLLVPMSENGNITVQTYRKLRWGDRTGLLLEAA